MTAQHTGRARPETAIEDPLVTVEPGQMAQTLLTVRNTGDEIAEYEVSLVPDCVAAPWTVAEPAALRLMPGADQQIALRFRPPVDSSTPAGSFPYGVRVMPRETEHQAPAVAEGDLAIGGIHALDVQLKPSQSKGRWRGRHTVLLDNQGTEDVRVRLSVAEDDEALSFALAPTTVAVPPGSKAEAYLRVRTASPRLFGKPADQSFAVTYRRKADSRTVLGPPVGGVPSGGDVSADVTGTFTQKPIISKLMLVLLALVIAGGAFLLVTRPWEEPPPRVAPRPPANLTFVSHAAGEIVVTWDSTPALTAVEIREVDCATRAAVIPTGTGEPTSVETQGSGRQSFTMGEMGGEPERCLQARAISGDEASMWVPNGARLVVMGQTLSPPTDVVAEHAGDCAVEVSWVTVAPETGEVAYEVVQGGAADGDDGDDEEAERTVLASTDTGSVLLEDQPAGETLELKVETVAGELDPVASEPVSVTVPDPCVGTDAAEEDDEGGGDGGGGGGAGAAGGDDEAGDDVDAGGDESTTEGGRGGGTQTPAGAAVLNDRSWLLFLPPAGHLSPEQLNTWTLTWQGIGADHVGLSPLPQPRQGLVGVDVLLPADFGSGSGFTFPVGTQILYVDLYGDIEDDDAAQAAAQEDCLAFNQEAARAGGSQGEDSNEIPAELGPGCWLVHPDGSVTQV